MSFLLARPASEVLPAVAALGDRVVVATDVGAIHSLASARIARFVLLIGKLPEFVQRNVHQGHPARSMGWSPIQIINRWNQPRCERSTVWSAARPDG